MKEMKTLTFPDGSVYEIVDDKCRTEVEKLSQPSGGNVDLTDEQYATLVALLEEE